MSNRTRFSRPLTARENLLETLLGPLIHRTTRKADFFQRRQDCHEVANLFASLALLTHGFVLLPGTLNVPTKPRHMPLGIV